MGHRFTEALLDIFVDPCPIFYGKLSLFRSHLRTVASLRLSFIISSISRHRGSEAATKMGMTNPRSAGTGARLRVGRSAGITDGCVASRGARPALLFNRSRR